MSPPASILPFQRPPEPGDDLTVPQVVELYLDYATRKGKYTADSLANRVRYLREFARDIPKLVKDCRPSDLELWLADHADRWGDWTRHSNCTMVQACFNWAARDKRIAHNPFLGVTVPEGDPRRAMTDEEFAALLRASDPAFRQILLFLRHTAARPGELRKLRWKHVDVERCLCELPPPDNLKGNIGRAKKKPRIIRLPDALVKMLAYRARNGTPAEGFIFTTPGGRQWSRNSLPQKVLRIRRRLGIPDDCKLYGTRHAFGTNAVKAGLDLKTVAELMGHSSAKTTEKYYVDLSGEEAHLQEKLKQATARPPKKMAQSRVGVGKSQAE